MYDLIVVGAGPGGYQAAVHASQMGKTVALVEKGELGGSCLNVGCIPAKTLLWSSRLYRQCTEAKSFGIEVGPARLDLRAVVDRKDRIVAAQKTGISGLLRRSEVEVLAGHARLVARNVVSVGGEFLEAANVLLATGSEPLIPPIVGISAEHVLTSSSVFELDEVLHRVAIVGGGYIGLELATFFAETGAEVAVFEVLPRVAGGCDQDVSENLLGALKRSGVVFNLSSEVLAVEENGVRYRDCSGGAKAFEAACVVNATGRAPMVTGVGLEEVGVDFSAKGVRVDNQGKTNVPGVWACGDVTGQHMLAHAATREGVVAVNCMFGKPDRVRYGSLPAVIYTHPEVAAVGPTEQHLRTAGVAYNKAMVPMGVAGRFMIENEKGTGFVKVLTGARFGEILGVHVVGDSASEFIVAAAALVEMELSIARAADLVFPHPTVGEALHEALLQAS